MTFADAHVHLFAAGYEGIAGRPPAGEDEVGAYEKLRRHHGVVRALVVGYEGEPRYGGNNDYVLGLAAERSWTTPLAFVPAAAVPAVEMLQELQARGSAGIAVYAPGEAEGGAIALWPASAKEELRRQRAVISFNATPAATVSLAGLVDDLEGCRILFSHLGLPGRRQAVVRPDEARAELAPLLALASRPHVAVKFSALYAVSEPAHEFPHAAAEPHVAALLESFGPERLLWGSDFSPALDSVSFAQTLDTRLLAGCTETEIAGVMGGNLIRLLDT